MTPPVAYSQLPDGELLTVKDVASWLKVSVRLVQRLSVSWVDCGERCWRYLVRDVKAWLDRRRTEAA